MLRPLLGALSPAGRQARLSTLIFHRVTAQPDPLFPGEVDALRFDAICGWVRRWANVLPLDEAVQRLAEGSLPARAMCFTFDDGYAESVSTDSFFLSKRRKRSLLKSTERSCFSFLASCTLL